MDKGEGARGAVFTPEETGRGAPETAQRAWLTLPQAHGPVAEPFVVPWQHGFGHRPTTPREAAFVEEFTVAWQLPVPRREPPGPHHRSGHRGH